MNHQPACRQQIKMNMQLFDTHDPGENLLPADGEVYLYPALFSAAACETIYQQLIDTISWKQEPIMIAGRSIMQPRLTAWYGDTDKPYSYSGITMYPHGWTALLQSIRERVEQTAGHGFSSALLNYYRDGKDSMGWHRDNEKELGPNPVIASLSFGATRIFHLKHIADKKLVRKIPLTTGSLLLMKGSTQYHWLHSIPKVSDLRGGRINITFRTIYH